MTQNIHWHLDIAFRDIDSKRTAAVDNGEAMIAGAFNIIRPTYMISTSHPLPCARSRATTQQSHGNNNAPSPA